MTSIFTHFLSFNNDQKRLQQFRKQVEKLSQQKESQKNDSLSDDNQFLRQCTDLRKQLDNYKRKIEGMKNEGEQHLKKNLLQDLETIVDQLSNLMTSDATTIENNSIKMSASSSISREEEKVEEEVEEEKNNLQEEVEEKEDIIEDSLKDSSSDPDYASDHSTLEEQHAAKEMNLREELEDVGSAISESNQFIAVANFEAQEEKDLTMKQNDLVRIIATRQDGWWLAQNANGERGFVPKTFLKVHKEMTECEKVAMEPTKPLPMPRRTIPMQISRKENSRIIRNEEITEKSKPLEGREQRNKINAPIISGIALPLNNGQFGETKILEESSSDNSKDMGQHLELSEPKILKTIIPKSFTQSITTPNPFKKNNDYRTHLTYECYLAPRLSKSNYAFHDIYWNYEDDRLRKRRVRVSKMIKIIRLDKVRLNTIDVHCRLIRAYLFDRKSAEEEYETVSNVYTIKAYPRIRDPQTWIFSTAKDMQKLSLNYPSFILRSNYKQRNVMLCLEATIIFSNHEGEMCEQSLGCVMLPIIDENGHCCMQNKNYTVKLFRRNSLSRKDVIPVNTQIQITFRISNVPNNIVHQVDSLPDIFLCHSLFLPMFFYYRRLLGQFLTKNNCGSAALKAEPFLAIFPAIADQPDMMEMLWQLWKIHEKNVANKKLSEMEEAERFRSFFLTTGFILHETVPMMKFNWSDARCFADRQAKLSHFREQYLHNFDAIKYISRQRCHPINIYNYAVDIIGPHAIS
uniref:SH3 domain-containing protein n=1 Tax=Elaeophora elaphi TaxID=1147741 RepID=A0A0R3RWN6_9BILA